MILDFKSCAKLSNKNENVITKVSQFFYYRKTGNEMYERDK